MVDWVGQCPTGNDSGMLPDPPTAPPMLNFPMRRQIGLKVLDWKRDSELNTTRDYPRLQGQG
jgi:hypothetical protein